MTYIFVILNDSFLKHFSVFRVCLMGTKLLVFPAPSLL